MYTVHINNNLIFFFFFQNIPVSDPEYSGANHHWFQFVERGEILVSLFIFRSSSSRCLKTHCAALLSLKVLPSGRGRIVRAAGVL